MIYDFIVIGAGMAGASAGYELSVASKVLIIEAETHPGYHASGRSAALFTRNYGTLLVRRINALSEPFFRAPPVGFADTPLLRPRGALAVAAPGEEAGLDAALALSTDADPLTEIAPAAALAMAPFLRPDRVARAIFEPGVLDIEVANLLHSYLKGFKGRGGDIVKNDAVVGLDRASGTWAVTTRKGAYRAHTIINAAGAWADEVGAMAGAKPLGLIAKRRTAIIIAAPEGLDLPGLPCVDFANRDAYIKPDAGSLMVSPGDATPQPAQDAQPDEMDVAVLVDWLERETQIKVRRIAHSWAGLRTFAPDEGPIVGRDLEVPNFIWSAGQGGYGIMMAPALAVAVAAICGTAALPERFGDNGVTLGLLGPERLRGP